MPVYAGVESIHWTGDLCSSAVTGQIRARDGRGLYFEATCRRTRLHVPKACFIGKKEYRNLRDPGHVQRVPDG